MLKILRKKGVMKKLLWAVAILIIISFGFLGEAYLMEGRSGATYAGKIFGRTVSVDEFERNYQNTRIQAMLQYGENFNKIRDYLNLESETWDRIILLHEAKKRGIRVSDEEVVGRIQSYPFFHRDGAFDQLLYNEILQYVFRVKPREFEEGVRDDIKFAKIYEQETADVEINPNELFNAFQERNEKVQVSYILFDIDQLKQKINFDEAALRQYYSSHQNEFVSPAAINVEYVRFDFPPPEGENKELTNKQIDEVYGQAIDFVDAYRNNENFTQAVKAQNLTVETSGFFSREKPYLKAGWPFPVIQQIFTYDTGYVTDPVETSSGFQVLRIKEKRDAYIPSFEEALPMVKEAWLKEEAMQVSKQAATEYLPKLQEEYNQFKLPDFAQIAKKHGQNIFQTKEFQRGDYLQNIGIAREFQEAAFRLNEENKLSGAVATPKGYAILHLDSIIPADRDEFEKQKDEFAAIIRQERKSAAFNDFLSLLRLKSNLEDNISKLLAEQQT